MRQTTNYKNKTFQCFDNYLLLFTRTFRTISSISDKFKCHFQSSFFFGSFSRETETTHQNFRIVNEFYSQFQYYFSRSWYKTVKYMIWCMCMAYWHERILSTMFKWLLLAVHHVTATLFVAFIVLALWHASVDKILPSNSKKNEKKGLKNSQHIQSTEYIEFMHSRPHIFIIIYFNSYNDFQQKFYQCQQHIIL